MSDRCVCGHEEREHVAVTSHGGTDVACEYEGENAERCCCDRYRRSPRSAFRGPSVSFTREEAAGWLRALDNHGLLGGTYVAAVVVPACDLRYFALDACEGAKIARRNGRHTIAARLYMCARILRAVRP